MGRVVSADMVTEYIRYRIDDDRRADFEEAYAAAAEVLAQSPHCVDFDLAASVEEPGCYILRIRWTSAEDHLKGFRTGELFPRFFASIKPFLGNIEEMRHYRTTSVHGFGSSVPSLYEWAGGVEAFERLTQTFYDAVRRDPVLAPVFAHMGSTHPHYVAMWLSEVFGGPDDYTRERDGYPHMLSQHVGRAITEAQRRRWVQLLLDSADTAGLPDDPEFRAAFTGYLEWGSRLAVLNSAVDAQPPPRAPVPRWSWGVAPPYVG